MGKVNFYVGLFFCFCMMSGGLIAQTYIPKELKKLPKDSLAKLVINSLFNVDGKNFVIDNQKVKNKCTVFLKPGKHLVEYSALVETEEWKNMVKSMEKQGYKLQSDGTFVKGGTTATPMLIGGPKRYKWIKKSKEIFLEVGKSYHFSYL